MESTIFHLVLLCERKKDLIKDDVVKCLLPLFKTQSMCRDRLNSFCDWGDFDVTFKNFIKSLNDICYFSYMLPILVYMAKL